MLIESYMQLLMYVFCMYENPTTFFRVNEEFHPGKSGYLSLRHCSNLHVYVSKINL